MEDDSSGVCRAYSVDLQRVSNEAELYAKSVDLMGDGKDVWIFDIVKTLPSNLPYYVRHGFGLAVFDVAEFDKWVDKTMAPAIKPSFRLYERMRDLAIMVFLLTVENLINVGIQNRDKFILSYSIATQHLRTRENYKSEKRVEMVSDGFKVLGNSDDQWSDLLGYAMPIHWFKLPKPMYQFPGKG